MSTEIPESHRDLLSTPVAMLATNAPSGHPQVTAIWFVWDEGEQRVKMSLNTDRAKHRNLQADPRATLFILDPQNPMRTLEIRGRVEMTPDEGYAFAGGPVKEKYGADVKEWDAPGTTRDVVTLVPDKVVPTLLG